MKKRIPALLSLAVLALLYWLIRYPLFRLHGMKDLPLVLLITGVLVIAAAGLLLGSKAVPIFTAAGYGAGFFLGCLCQWDYGIGLNSLWIIWTLCYLVMILLGAAVGVAGQRKKEWG